LEVRNGQIALHDASGATITITRDTYAPGSLGNGSWYDSSHRAVATTGNKLWSAGTSIYDQVLWSKDIGQADIDLEMQRQRQDGSAPLAGTSSAIQVASQSFPLNHSAGAPAYAGMVHFMPDSSIFADVDPQFPDVKPELNAISNRIKRDRLAHTYAIHAHLQPSADEAHKLIALIRAKQVYAELYALGISYDRLAICLDDAPVTGDADEVDVSASKCAAADGASLSAVFKQNDVTEDFIGRSGPSYMIAPDSQTLVHGSRGELLQSISAREEARKQKEAAEEAAEDARQQREFEARFAVARKTRKHIGDLVCGGLTQGYVERVAADKIQVREHRFIPGTSTLGLCVGGLCTGGTSTPAQNYDEFEWVRYDDVALCSDLRE
jgi:hypothetical protein